MKSCNSNANIHDSLAHCGRNKLLDALHTHFLGQYLLDNISNILIRCTICNKDKMIPKPMEELKFLDKSNTPF